MKTRLVRSTLLMIGAVLAIAVVVSVAQGSSQQTAPGPGAQEQPKKMQAVWAVRAINTAEMQFQRARGRFASFSELVSSGEFTRLKGQWAAPFAGADVAKPEEDAVPGYKLRLVVANGGASYSMRLIDAGSCEASFFSDEVGVIFQGYALGCESSAGGSR